MIRRANNSDIEALVRIGRETFVSTFESQNNPEDTHDYVQKAFSHEALAEELSNAESEFFFFEKDREVAAYLKLNTGEAQTEKGLENALEIERLYVLDQYQGQRLGKALFEFAIRRAAESSRTWLWLGVWEENQKAIAFYESQGLSVFGDHIFNFGNTPQRDLLMRLRIT